MLPAQLRKKRIFRDSNSGKDELAATYSAVRDSDPRLSRRHHDSAIATGAARAVEWSGWRWRVDPGNAVHIAGLGSVAMRRARRHYKRRLSEPCQQACGKCAAIAAAWRKFAGLTSRTARSIDGTGGPATRARLASRGLGPRKKATADGRGNAADRCAAG